MDRDPQFWRPAPGGGVSLENGHWVSPTAGTFFLYLAHYAVHTPLQTKPELVRKYRAKPPGTRHRHAEYAAMIESVDTSVGRVLDKLDEMQLSDETLVIFFSDNGGFQGATANFPLRGGKGMLYEDRLGAQASRPR